MANSIMGVILVYLYFFQYALKWAESAIVQLDTLKITNEQKINFLHKIQKYIYLCIVKKSILFTPHFIIRSSIEENPHSLEKNVKELARIFR